MKSSRIFLSTLALSSAVLMAGCGSNLQSTTSSLPKDDAAATTAVAATTAAAEASSAAPSSAAPSSAEATSAAPTSAAPTQEAPKSAAPMSEEAKPSPTTPPTPEGETTANVALGQDLPFPDYIDNNKPYVTTVLHAAERQTVGTSSHGTNADDCWYFAGSTLSTGASIPETMMCPLYSDDSAWVMMDPANNYAIQAFFTTDQARITSDAEGRVSAGSVFAGQKVAQSQIVENRIGKRGPLYGFVKLDDGHFTGK